MSLRLTIDYPETFPDALQQTREQFEEEALRGNGSQTFRDETPFFWYGGYDSRCRSRLLSS